MLDKNKIYLGDCFELMKEIPDKSVDCILTDPPYGITACKWDVKLDLDKMWVEFKRICNGNIVMFASQPFTTDLICSNRDMFRYELIWNKKQTKQPMLANVRFMKAHENILVFYKLLKTFNPQKTKEVELSSKAGDVNYYDKRNKSNYSIHRGISKPREVNYEGRYITSILNYTLVNGQNVHPTEKPIELISVLIKAFTDETQLVLDPFSGSGTTAIACHELNRNFICIEKDPEYYKMSCDRLEKAKQQGRLL